MKRKDCTMSKLKKKNDSKIENILLGKKNHCSYFQFNKLREKILK
jgi:hypothetical protein